jgi:hypothetical protein
MESMVIHHSIQLEIAVARQRDLLAQAERDRLVRAGTRSKATGYRSASRPARRATSGEGTARLGSGRPRSNVRELARRANGGIEVALLWSEEDGGLTVTVTDSTSGQRFALDAAPSEALDVFRHPYAHAFRGRALVRKRSASLEPLITER